MEEALASLCVHDFPGIGEMLELLFSDNFFRAL
jgi:hypothetical protein